MTRTLPIAPGVTVLVSAAWDTTCTVVDAPAGLLVVDGPVLPDDHAALAALVRGRPATVLVTHADWDHLRAVLEVPGARVVTGAATARRLRADAAGIAAEADEEYRRRGLPAPPAPDLTAAEAVEVPAVLPTPAGMVRAVTAAGHTPDGTAFVLAERGLVWPGDYLSPVEIPSVTPGKAADYLATLDRLEGLLDDRVTVIPGHGHPLDAGMARRILAEDRAYVRALAAGDDPVPPRGDDAAWTAHVHALNRAAAGVPTGG